jgi:hypothetical protein
MSPTAPVATAPVETDRGERLALGNKEVNAKEVNAEGGYGSLQGRSLFGPRVLRIVTVTTISVLYVLSLVSPTVRHLMGVFAAYLPK